MCIAGILGGKGSGTYDSTKNVLFESAYFNPTTIRKSARRHGLNTDASFRFERGIDPNGVIYALKQAAILAKELAGGTVSMEIKDVNTAPVSNFNIHLDYKYLNNLIGKTIPRETVKDILSSLEIQLSNETEDGIDLAVPPYRVDVKRPCDIAEEILRIYGYNNVQIPTSIKSSLTIKGEEDRSNKLQNLISEQLTAQGFNEILNNSLTKAVYYDSLESYPLKKCVRLLNPLSEDLCVLRQTLLFGGLESLRFNINHKSPNLKMYEFGKTYSFKSNEKDGSNRLGAYSEELHLGLWITGNMIENSWTNKNQQYSFYNIKAYVENIFTRLGVNIGLMFFKEFTSDLYSSALQITDRNEKVYATMGIISNKVLKLAELKAQIFYADISWQLLMKINRKNIVSYKEISKFPSVSRDLALLLDKKITFQEIEAVAYQTERNLLKKIELFDVYEGNNLPENKKSYAINFTLQDPNKTLTDKQIDKVMKALMNNFKHKLQADLR